MFKGSERASKVPKLGVSNLKRTAREKAWAGKVPEYAAAMLRMHSWRQIRLLLLRNHYSEARRLEGIPSISAFLLLVLPKPPYIPKDSTSSRLCTPTGFRGF